VASAAEADKAEAPPVANAVATAAFAAARAHKVKPPIITLIRGAI